MGESRVICWFSCGDASAVACRMALKKYVGRDTVIARIVIQSEHEDNERFASDCVHWYGQPIIELRNDEYADTWDVWESRKYITPRHLRAHTGSKVVMFDAIKIRYYIWRIRRAYAQKQQSECDVMNARSEALWYLDRKLKPLSEKEYKHFKYCGDF